MRMPAGLRCLLTVTLLSAAALAQSNYAGVTGTVRDVQSLPVAKATVQFTALSTGAVRVVTTNDKGLFYAPALTPDDYELVTQAPGFAPVTQSLRLEVGQKLAIENQPRGRAHYGKVFRSRPWPTFSAQRTPVWAR
mgnify:CR=1 FL=1